MDLKNKKVLIAGMGKSGIASMEVLVEQGADVTVYDKKTRDEIDESLFLYLREKKIKYYFGVDPWDPGSFDTVVISPGLSPNLNFILQAFEGGAEIIGEIELAYRLSRCNYVAITGTNGKTTTTTLTGEIFRKAGKKTEIVGNVGIPVISKAVNADSDEWMVTEVSSFQLETIAQFHPHVSAVLNITPDHMDRHKTMEKYAGIKGRIYKNQQKEDFFVVNYDDPKAYALAEGCPATVVGFSKEKECRPGCFLKDGRIVIAPLESNHMGEGEYLDICGAGDLKIPGTHNLENAMAAAAVAYFAGIDYKTIGMALTEFDGVEHRMEFVDEIHGVRYINDSKGTNPDASIKAINAIKGNIILIAGGYDKDASFREFTEAFSGKVKKLLLLGKTASLIRKTAEEAGFTDVGIYGGMEECVSEAYKIAKQGDTVLLSPACASWDMYESYEKRGEHFKKCVKELVNKRGRYGSDKE